MNLRLKYPPIPENVSKFSEDIVKSASRVSGARLDYSSASLAIVDGIIDSFAKDGCKVEEIQETLFAFGCYVGEVFVRTGHGFWRAPKTPWEEQIFGFPLIIELAPDNVCNPIGKVFKRLKLGGSENLSYFYAVFASERKEKERESPSQQR
jgi:hypothetical protein